MLGAGNLTLDNSANSLRVAREHCANYVEVAHDGTIYDDWRLPTRAELEIIMNFQGKEDEDADAFAISFCFFYSSLFLGIKGITDAADSCSIHI